MGRLQELSGRMQPYIDRLMSAVFLLLLALGAVAVPAGTVEEEPVVLKVWQLPDPKKTDAFNRADLAVVRAFRERFPYVDLRPFCC